MRLFGQPNLEFGPLPESSLPVIIVGAGPVGLTLALGLARQGVPVQVFETLPELRNLSKPVDIKTSISINIRFAKTLYFVVSLNAL